MENSPFYQFSAKSIGGETISMELFKGKPLLIVNTASNCGFTKQYRGLEDLYQKYKDQGFEILGFPCNQFGAQEPGEDTEISQFCEINYGVSFPLFSKVDVNGSDAHPIFQWLSKELPGLLGTTQIKWNFTKFFIDKNGVPVKRFAPKDTPEDVEKEIKNYLN